MPICIECGFKLNNLYTTYSKADDRTLGKGVRLTQCPRCKRFADKYVEHDFVVIFIDLILIKPQVYRHLLFNRLSREDDRLDPTIIRLGVLLLLFDVYLTWARIEKATFPDNPSLSPPLPLPSTPLSTNLTSNSTHSGDSNLLSSSDPGHHQISPFLSEQSILAQYLFFLLLCGLETVAFHLPIRLLLAIPPSSSDAASSTQSPASSKVTAGASADATSPTPKRRGFLPRPFPYYPQSSLISTALLVSSFTKLFPLLLLIWRYDLPSSASAVSWAVIINNIAALEILLDCGFVRAMGLCAIGAVARGLVGWGILKAVGVEGGVAAAGVVETGDLLDLWNQVTGNIGLG